MRFAYTILYVPDVTKTIAFYESAFGLTRRFIDDTGRYGEMETGGTALGFVDETLMAESYAGFRRNRPGEPPSGSEIGLVTDNVAASFAHAVANGAEAVMAPMQKPWGQTVSFVRDLNGYMVEICSVVSA